MIYPSATTPTPDRIVGIASSARDWLASTLEHIPERGDVAVRALCHVLVASWIAETMAGGDSATSVSFAHVAQQVARSLNEPENINNVDGVQPTMRLLVELLLSSEGLAVAPFRQFLTQSVLMLRRADPALEADPSLMDKRILLHSAGILPSPPASSADGMQALLDAFHLSASRDVVEALTLELECLTAWGTHLVDPSLVEPSLGEILAGFSVLRLRNYDLIPAARLLRLQEYLVASRAMVRRDDLYDVLCLQHRVQGSFGWYGPQSAQLRKQGPLSRADIEFSLPTTLEFLWTLAERWLDGWRLFREVPPYAV